MNNKMNKIKKKIVFVINEAIVSFLMELNAICVYIGNNKKELFQPF